MIPRNIIRHHIIDTLTKKGLYLTFFNFFRFGGVFMKPELLQESHDIDVSFSIWKFGCHFHLTKYKDNICQDVENRKSK